MNEELLAKTGSKYLGELKKLVQWAIGIAFVATVLAIQGKDTLKVLELELARVEAFYLLSILYSGLCAAVLAYIVRLSQLIASVPNELLEPILDRLARHESLVNPFAAYPWPSLQGRTRHWGFILLIAIFWLGVTSLYALIFENHLPLIDLLRSRPIAEPTFGPDVSLWQGVKIFALSLLPFVPLGVLVLLGYRVMEEVISIPQDAALRLPEPDARARLNQMAKDLKEAADMGIGVGGTLLLVVLLLGAFSDLWRPGQTPLPG